MEIMPITPNTNSRFLSPTAIPQPQSPLLVRVLASFPEACFPSSFSFATKSFSFHSMPTIPFWVWLLVRFVTDAFCSKATGTTHRAPGLFYFSPSYCRAEFRDGQSSLAVQNETGQQGERKILCVNYCSREIGKNRKPVEIKTPNNVEGHRP